MSQYNQTLYRFETSNLDHPGIHVHVASNSQFGGLWGHGSLQTASEDASHLRIELRDLEARNASLIELLASPQVTNNPTMKASFFLFLVKNEWVPLHNPSSFFLHLLESLAVVYRTSFLIEITIRSLNLLRIIYSILHISAFFCALSSQDGSRP